MKNSSASIGFLSKQYRNILIKCAMINMGLLMMAPEAYALKIDKNVFDVNSRYEITDNIGIGGITESIIDIDYDEAVDAVHKRPVVTVSGRVEGYTGSFSATYGGKYERFSTFIFKDWDANQTFNTQSNGFFVFDKQDTPNNVVINVLDNAPHIFLNGNNFSNSSSNSRMNLYLDGFMSETTGHNVTLENYNHDTIDLFAGGLRNTANGDVNTTIKNSKFNSIHGGGQGADINGSINLVLDSTETTKVIGNYLEVDNFTDTTASRISIAYVTGDVNVTLKNNSIAKSVYGQQVLAAGNENVGLGGTINVSIEDSLVRDDVRGSTGGSSDLTWANEYLSTNDVVINVTDSTVGGEVVSLGSYGSADDVTININGNTKIGYDENGNHTDFGTKFADGWVIAGTSRIQGNVNNTIINLDTKGENNTIDIIGYVTPGSRFNGDNNTTGSGDVGSVKGNATLNILGGGTVNVGALRGGVTANGDSVEGKSSLNINNVSVISNATNASFANGEVLDFDEINMDEKSTLTATALRTESDAIVNVKLTDTSNYSKIRVDELDVNGAKINLNIGDEGVYNVVDAGSVTSDFSWNLEHNLYQVTEDDGTVTVSVKSADKFAEDLGVSKGDAENLSSMISADKNGSEKGQQVAQAVKDALKKGNSEEAVKIANDASANDSKFIGSVTKEIVNTLANVSFNRLDKRGLAVGMASGDEDLLSNTWVEAVSGHAKQDASSSTDGFSADINGVSFGFDKKINSKTTVGIGYGYMSADTESANKDTDVTTHNIFVYGKYQPSQWYVRSMLGYSFGEAEENKSAGGVALNGEFDVSSYNAQVMSGYELGNGFTPEGGLRYVKAEADGFYDGMQYINYGEDDILTAVMGVKYSSTLDKKISSYTITPSAKVAVIYDLVSDSSDANAWVAGGNKYSIISERLDRFGVETAVGLTVSKENIDLTVEYNGEFRGNYEAHSGLINLKYNF